MKVFLRIVAVGSIIFGLFVLFHREDYSYEINEFQGQGYEEFEPSLCKFNTLLCIENAIDSIYTLNNKKYDSLVYVQTASDFIKKRFFHIHATYDWKTNWICLVLSKLIWADFNIIVPPVDVAKHPHAFCSQQEMVFTSILRKKGYNYRIVGINGQTLGGHFCSSVWANGGWHFFDVDMEPSWDSIPFPANIAMDTLIKYDMYKNLYPTGYEVIRDLANDNPSISFSEVNPKPGKNMILFQTVMKWMSGIVPIVFGCILLFKTKNKLTI